MQRVTWFKDVSVGLLEMVFGPLMPKLKVEDRKMAGVTAIVTGSNSGIGLQMALALAQRGAHVVLAVRSVSKGEEAAKRIRSTVPEAKLEVKQLDSASFESIRNFAKDWATEGRSIDLLYHNAGSPGVAEEFTDDGFESTYQINFLSQFYATYLLERFLSSNARVIFSSSFSQYSGSLSPSFSEKGPVKHKFEAGFHGPTAARASESKRYGQSKLMQAALARLLAKRYAESSNGRVAVSWHPGYCATSFLDKIQHSASSPDALFSLLKSSIQIFGISEEQGACTGVWLGVTQDKRVLIDGNGGYYTRMRKMTGTPDLYSDEKLERLWTRWCADCEIEWK